MDPVWTVRPVACLRVEHEGDFCFAPKKAVDVSRLICVLRGKIVFTFAKKTVAVSEGESVYLPARLASRARYTEKENVTLVFRFLPLEGPFPASFHVYPKNEAVHTLALRFADDLKTDPNPDGHLALSFFYKILFHLQEGVVPGRNKARLLPALCHIRQNFTRREKVSSWAKLCFMSETSFRKIFREEMGESPVSYRNRLRMRFARDLMAEGIPRVEAVEKAGFGSIAFYQRLRRREKDKAE